MLQRDYCSIFRKGDVCKVALTADALPQIVKEKLMDTKTKGEGKTKAAKLRDRSWDRSLIPGRQAGLNAEQAATTQLDAAGNFLRLQKSPKP